MIRDLKHGCGLMVESGWRPWSCGFLERWTQGVALGFVVSSCLACTWEASLSALSPAGHGDLWAFHLGTLNCVRCGNLPISHGVPVSPPGTIFCVQLSSLDVCQSIASARLSPAMQGPRHAQVGPALMVLGR